AAPDSVAAASTPAAPDSVAAEATAAAPDSAAVEAPTTAASGGETSTAIVTQSSQDDLEAENAKNEFIQRLTVENSELENRLAYLEKEIDALEAKNAELEKTVADLSPQNLILRNENELLKERLNFSDQLLHKLADQPKR
ncbi:MAG: DUF4515 domain-containing protein, partial [Deltaproteobacteria bacterium]|nr:DUF4515 domain-containing protein [Deltaproteobacteria bacterium]